MPQLVSITLQLAACTTTGKSTAAKNTVNDFFEGEELHFRNGQSPENKAAIIRYLLLETELAAEGKPIQKPNKQSAR